jgi:hypothetical protein
VDIPRNIPKKDKVKIPRGREENVKKKPFRREGQEGGEGVGFVSL